MGRVDQAESGSGTHLAMKSGSLEARYMRWIPRICVRAPDEA